MTKRTKSTVSSFPVEDRRNWGYWDGVAARERGYRFPDWSNGRSGRTAHPFDKAYGESFWMGWYNEPHPNAALISAMDAKIARRAKARAGA